MKPKDPRYPSNVLTVIIRDDAPMVLCGDSPSYRAVSIVLTEEQIKALALYHTGSSGPVDLYETISRTILNEVRS